MTKASVYYKIDSPSFPNGTVRTSWRLIVTIGNKSFEDTDSLARTVTVTNLQRGSNNSISYNITLKKWYTLAVPTETGYVEDGGHTVYTPVFTGSLTVYTHPGTFSFNASADSDSSNNIIANVLTANNVNNWAEHFNKVYKWKE